MNYPSKVIEDAVNEFSKFPGIGKKTALRLVLHLLKGDERHITAMGDVMARLKTDIHYCQKCGNIADADLCGICNSHNRVKTTVCLVEDLRDVMAIENTGQYTGVYHILGGLISPIDGVGPEDLRINELIERIQADGVEEVIMALSATMEGDTTVFYVSKKLKEKNIKITSISRGIAFGGELEYADEITLGRSIVNRIPYSA